MRAACNCPTAVCAGRGAGIGRWRGRGLGDGTAWAAEWTPRAVIVPDISASFRGSGRPGGELPLSPPGRRPRRNTAIGGTSPWRGPRVPHHIEHKFDALHSKPP
ncbi:hypothetical protein GCM10023088_72660 [Actinomadura verrucosospora]